MVDRRSFFRFWTSASRRLPTNRTTRPTPLVAKRAGESLNAGQLNGGTTSSTSTAPLPIESRENMLLTTESNPSGSPVEPVDLPTTSPVDHGAASSLDSATKSQPSSTSETDLVSKESIQIYEEVKVSTIGEALTSSSDEKGLAPAASEQEPQMKLESVSNVSSGDFSGEAVEETGVKHGESLVELNEEVKDVKEVVQVQGKRNEVNDNILDPTCGSEEHTTDKVEVARKPEKMHTESEDATDNDRDSQSKTWSTFSDAQLKGAHVRQMAIADSKAGDYSSPVNVISLAGENRGASMQMSSNSSTRVEPVHIHRGYKRSPDGSGEESTDGEGSSKGKQAEDAKAKEDQPTEAYVNNNAQGINNSIVFYGSIAERNPGVHMAVTLVPKELILSRQGISFAQAQKDEVAQARMGRLMYKPTLRRRCLRGLFLETSDSEPENPEKPRRHGCRVGCQKRTKDKENNVDLL